MELVKNYVTHTHTSVQAGYTILRFRAELYVEQVYMSGTFTKVNTQVHTADTNKQSTFYLDGILRSYLDFESLNHDFDSDFAIDIANSIRRYRVDITEIKDGVNGSVVTGTVKYVLLAGKTLRNFHETFSTPSFTAFGNHTYIFLTTKPMRRVMTKNQQEYLFLLPLTAITDAEFVIKINYTNETSELVPVALGNLAQYDGKIIRISYTETYYETINPSLIIKSLEFYLNENSTERIIYDIYEPITDNPIELFYANSLGGFDSLICEGATTDKVIYTRELVNRYTSKDFELAQGDTYNTDSTAVRRLEISSGYKEKKDILALRDLAISGKILIRENGEFVPFTLITAEGPDFNKDDQTWYYRFEGYYLYREKAFDRVV